MKLYVHVCVHVCLCVQSISSYIVLCATQRHASQKSFVFVFVAVSGGIAGGGGGGGWGFAGMQQQQQQPIALRNPQQPNYEAMFNSLFPINGMVTGTLYVHVHTCTCKWVGGGGVWSTNVLSYYVMYKFLFMLWGV